MDEMRDRNDASPQDGEADASAPDERERGEPGDGRGRRDEVGPTGVFPPSAENIPSDAEVRMAGSWGGGDYDEAGGSEVVYRGGVLLGGLTAGPSGEPTIDVHPHDAPPAPDTATGRDAMTADESAATRGEGQPSGPPAPRGEPERTRQALPPPPEAAP